MDTAQLTDLKQFITGSLTAALAPINASLNRIERRLDSLELRMDSLELRMDALENRVNKLEKYTKKIRQEMRDGFSGVGEAIEYIHTQDDERDLMIMQLSKKWRNDRL